MWVAEFKVQAPEDTPPLVRPTSQTPRTKVQTMWVAEFKVQAPEDTSATAPVLHKSFKDLWGSTKSWRFCVALQTLPGLQDSQVPQRLASSPWTLLVLAPFQRCCKCG